MSRVGDAQVSSTDLRLMRLKKYYRHSGYPGGISETTFKQMQEKHPGRAIEKAVKGMLPSGPLGYAMFKKLKVYGGSSHPHSAQQPQTIDF